MCISAKGLARQCLRRLNISGGNSSGPQDKLLLSLLIATVTFISVNGTVSSLHLSSLLRTCSLNDQLGLLIFIVLCHEMTITEHWISVYADRLLL